MQGEGDEAQQGAEGGREEEAQGHLRDHARRRPVRGLAGGGINRRGSGGAGRPDASCRNGAKHAVDKTIETRPKKTVGSCGGIVPVFAAEGFEQELFHRNL